MRRCHQRIGRNIVIRMPQRIRHIENEYGIQNHEHEQAKCILDRVIRMERQSILRPLRINTKRIVRSGHVERPNVQHHHGKNYKRQHKVQREKARQRRVINRIPAEQQRLDPLTHKRNCGKESCDNRRTPKAHLPPWQHITKESRRHHQKENHNTQNPQQLARTLIRTVIHPAEHMDVDGNKEERCAVHVNIADQPATIHIAHNPLDAIKRQLRIRRIMHRQKQTRDNHRHQHEQGNRTEIPEIVEVFRRRKNAVFLHQHCKNRHTGVDPLHHRIIKFFAFSASHDFNP